MIPSSHTYAQQLQTVEQPTRTWRLDFQRGKVVGMIDGLDAIRQAVVKVLPDRTVSSSDLFWGLWC